tara:strand:+ start:10651 stop:14721 length:4071 start_codon:yes stop_codon:yes gene_type:complete
MSEELTLTNESPDGQPANTPYGVEVTQEMEERISDFSEGSGALTEEGEVNEQLAAALEAQGGAESVQVDDSQGFLPDGPGQLVAETGRALVGGAADAVESVGGFLELSGDTIKTWAHSVYSNPYDGNNMDPTQNPFSSEYVHGDGNWLDIPDHLVPENKSGLGSLARGLVEFGLLTAATGGVGGYTAGAARTGTRIVAAGRAAGIGAKGSRFIKVFHRGTVVAGEGAIADLISNSSETANIANLVQEHAPWVPFAEALAVDPEKDSPWIARIKTMAAGGGLNLVGDFLAAYIKASWKGAKAMRKGMSTDDANTLINKEIARDMDESRVLNESAATERAANNWEQGKGISNIPARKAYISDYLDELELQRYDDPATSQLELDDLDELANQRGIEDGNPWDIETQQSARQFEESLSRKPDSAVNPNLFSDSDKATYRPDSPDPVKTNLRESIADMKAGGEGRSYSPMWTEAAMNKMTQGDVKLRRWIIEAGDKIAKEVFRDLDNTLNHKEVQQLILKQATEMHAMLSDGGEGAVKQLQNYFRKGDNGIVYTYDGIDVVTGNASQKAALQLVINTLAKQASTIAGTGRRMADSSTLTRQFEQVHDLMRVALIEHKKIGFMAGSELALHKNPVLSSVRKTEISAGLKDIEDRTNKLFDELDKLAKAGNHKDRRMLMELYELSGGKVNTMDHISEWLQSQVNLRGGRMNGENITPRWRTEARSVFYNSILSSLKTPVKAIAGTNLIALLRPFQAYLGAGLKGDKVEMVLATAQIDAIGKAWAEGFQMFKHNWELGVNRQAQTYIGKFDFEKNIEEWKEMATYYKEYGTPAQQAAYNRMDWIVDLNNNPWMRYSANAMGAGDALARTIIGRYEMRMRAARQAVEDGIDINDVRKWADKYEENFRNEIFKKNADGKFVVSDKAARLAGDEAAMTKALEGNLAGFEQISKITGMRAFFPFVRTGYNSLRLAFGHTELNRFTAQFHDVMRGENLTKYGIRPEDLPQAQALMRGRMAMGNTIIGMGTIAAATGVMTGSPPKDKETRDLWRINGIQPFSFKFGDLYVSYKDVEPFNTLFAATANVVQHSHVLGEDIRDEYLEKLVFMTTAVLVDKSMLAGVQDLADVLSADTAGGSLKRTGAKFIRSHLPYAGLMAQLGGLMDANMKEANTMLEQIFQRDAVFKSIFYQPKYDFLSKDRSGKKLARTTGIPLLDWFNAVSPVAVTIAENDPVKNGLKEMSFNLPEEVSTFKGEPLNSYERSQLQKYLAMGDLRKRLEHAMRPGGVWRKTLSDYQNRNLRQADGYELYKQRYYRIIKKIFTEEKAQAMTQLRLDNPKLAERIKLRLTKKKISESSNYRLIDTLINMPK